MFSLLNRPPCAAGITLAASLWLAVPHTFADPLPSYEVLIEQIGQTPFSQEAVARYDAAEARVMQASLRPNPSLTVETENAYGSGPYSGLGRADSTVSISQPLEIWGQREARIGAARADADVAALRREQTDKAVAARIALAYADAEAALLRHGLAQEALALTRQEADAARSLVDEGRTPRLRLIQAESEVASAQAQQVEAQANRDAALARLSALVSLDKAASSIPYSLLDRLPQSIRPVHPDPLPVRVAQAERDAARQLVTVEKTRGRPDLSATLGVRRFEETGDRAFSLGINLSIPLFDRNQGAFLSGKHHDTHQEPDPFQSRFISRCLADRLCTGSTHRWQGDRVTLSCPC